MSYATRLDLRDLGAEYDDLLARNVDEDQDDPLDQDERERLDALQALADELGDDLTLIGNDYECTFIRESDFVEYAQELAEDIGAIPDDRSWPMTCIDWDQAAKELAYDYTTVTFDGDEWMIRSW